MASIDLRHPHHLELSEARGVVDRLAQNMQQKYGVTGQWNDSRFEFARSGLNGFIALTASEIHFHAELGFLYAAFKATIAQEVERKLAAHFD